MKPIRLIFLSLLTLFSASTVLGQADRARVLDAARDVMQKARYCTLITLHQGQAQARVVDPFEPDQAMTIWMATHRLTRKVSEIRRNPRVTLHYFDTDRMAQVTLVGRAKIVDDPAEKKKRWKADWSPFYKDENRGSDYLLIRFTPQRLEIFSEAHELRNDPVNWRPVTITFPSQ
jgi:general stress protein 26